MKSLPSKQMWCLTLEHEKNPEANFSPAAYLKDFSLLGIENYILAFI